MPSDYPHLFNDIGFLNRQTQLYTQRRQNSELPENYKFNIEFLLSFVITEFQLITADNITYTHSQLTPSATWTVIHNLGRDVQVRCVDDGDNNIVGEPFNDSSNQITITFTTPVAGVAIVT